ncbi:WD40 repeat-like protein [Suillus hirtellus]|nr:WD40 repeat-like protein [Suillus hirtellus]
MPKVTPRQMIRTPYTISGVVHLPGGREILTCSWDNSLRLWDLESGTQIGEDWRDEEVKEVGMLSMTLSPNGKIIVSGSGKVFMDGKVKLWDVETGKVVAKWSRHTDYVYSVCWSADGKRVLSGSRDRTARVWNVKTEKTILTIKTGHCVRAAIYSPDHTQIGTGGFDEFEVKIWEAQTGKLLATLKHDDTVTGLAWTSDGKKLISGSICVPIRIYDTTTWQQIANLEGHANVNSVEAITLFHRLLVSASPDKTARLWNLDTNLPVGPPLQHEDAVSCAALSADGKVLVTGCEDKNAYIWDIHAILKDAGLEDLLSIPHSLKDTHATRRPHIQAPRIPPGFFDDTQHVVHIHSLLRTILAILAHPYLPFHVLFSHGFRHSCNPLTPMPMEKPNSGNVQRAPSSLAILLSSKLLQYRTRRHYMLLRGHGRSGKCSCMARTRRRNLSPPPHPLKVLALPHQVQQPPSHHPSHCGLVLSCLSVVHLPRTPMVINAGAAHVQSFYPSHFPSILFPRRETRAIMLTVTIKTSYSFPSLQSRRVTGMQSSST